MLKSWIKFSPNRFKKIWENAVKKISNLSILSQFQGIGGLMIVIFGDCWVLEGIVL
jgi:hypothetical protein